MAYAFQFLGEQIKEEIDMYHLAFRVCIVVGHGGHIQ